MITVCLLAAGKGERTALKDNKIKYHLNDKPLFMHAYNTFKEMGYNIITVSRKEDIQYIQSYIDTKVVEGGLTRLDSVSNALKHVSSKYVLIHDAARPFIKQEVIFDLVNNFNKYDALMVCKDVTSTIYNKDLKIIDRTNLIEAETPQGFLTSKLKEAFINRSHGKYTDDISLYKDYYKNDEIGLIYHNYNNDKITTEKSLKRYFMLDYKIGHSYDIHQLVENRKLILGGVTIKHNKGLLGHSDADVLLHALSESILGALGLGDLGKHFPDTDLKYKDLDSKEILKYANEKMLERDYSIANIDASIYAEEPKLASYINDIRINIANILNIEVDKINLKAGTNEKMDSIGKKQAIASEVVCLLKGYKR